MLNEYKHLFLINCLYIRQCLPLDTHVHVADRNLSYTHPRLHNIVYKLVGIHSIVTWFYEIRTIHSEKHK